ncbi:Cation transporting ATPase [Alteracholeplasma palmae J233]|uniref:Cation transporting ATPase n=1 Tax=Alteracholeplasma palmae (strain ATCC 49389 / J233) TaxID=1318466 RepID=U4KQ61_ALTPJ|nr:cation-translocating P-type ATPase [Alteracholeplasma palmae]CCV64415.1 Cation transporting ATPase [Alteracholeplasma palmae J233]
MEKQVYQQTKDELLKSFDTNEKLGLSEQEVLIRTEKYGKNKLAEAKKRSLFLRFIDQLKDFMVLILIGASLLSFLMAILEKKPEEMFEGGLIIAIVLINALLGIMQESKAEKALESIKAMSSPHAKVIRGGKDLIIDVADLVIGDIVVLEAGDYMPADVRIIQSVNLKADESALTGEAVPVEKSALPLEDLNIPLGDRVNLGFMGTVVTYGRGLAVVTSVGMDTEIGKIAAMLNETESDTTPLQKNIAQLGKFLAIIALAITAVIFAITIIEAYAFSNAPVTFEVWKDALLTSVALAVAAIPEGLPAIITIVLALGMQNLVKQRAIMRTLPAVETLGSTTIICSDKTGTLTQNVMTVQELYLNKNTQKVSNLKMTPQIERLVSYGVLCNDTKIREENDSFVKIGDPTEIAFVDLAITLKENPITINASYDRIHELPFDSERKLMTTVHKFKDGIYAVIKGAPDVLFKRTKFIDDNGSLIPNDAHTIKEFETANNNMADKALRVLAIAYKKVDNVKDVSKLSYADLETDVTLLGLVGMIDPARPEAKDAIVQCKKAGITTIMITGDHKNTAVAIATELGILGKDDIAITGHELDLLSDDEFAQRLAHIRVYARVSPENKVRIVKAWRATGLVVAMTGDGVNDAPSIKQADIGIAMGITGTEVAKGAADMVLTDDNFATIVNAVSEGRAIFSNIKKSIHFLLSCNIGEIVTIFLGTTLGILLFGETVTTLTAAQILWVNLVTDSLMAIGLGLEPKEPDIMDYAPRDSKKSIFSDGLGFKIAWQGLMIGLLTFAAYYIGYTLHFDEAIAASQGHLAASEQAQTYAQTLTFMVLAISQLIHAFNARSETHSPFKLKMNKFLIMAFFISLVLQLVTVAIPFTRNIFGIQVPTLLEWGLIVALSVTPLIVVEITKIFNKVSKKKKTNL